MVSGKRILAIMGAVVVLGSAGYTVVKNNPYNNSNITFMNKKLNKFSKEMDDFIKYDFNDFNKIMYALQNGNYNSCVYSDINKLDKYINTIMACNFKGYQDDLWDYRDRNTSGFVIEFENYFPLGSEERTLVEKFSGYYEKGVYEGYRYIDPDMEKIVENCTADYHKFKTQIYRLPILSRYVVLKIVRPIIAKNNFQYYPNYKRDVTLNEIDLEISKCIYTMQKQCHDPEINYNVSRK